MNWILVDASNELSSETIHKSFNACTLTSATDGSEDNNIYCLKGDQPCNAGLKMLADQLKLTHGQEANPFVPGSSGVVMIFSLGGGGGGGGGGQLQPGPFK